jgi:hypothetical protein
MGRDARKHNCGISNELRRFLLNLACHRVVLLSRGPPVLDGSDRMMHRGLVRTAQRSPAGPPCGPHPARRCVWEPASSRDGTSGVRG